jgi:hypothetical protein
MKYSDAAHLCCAFSEKHPHDKSDLAAVHARCLRNGSVTDEANAFECADGTLDRARTA